MAVKKKKGLGRGLDALIAPSVPQANHSTVPAISNDTSTLPTPSLKRQQPVQKHLLSQMLLRKLLRFR